MILAIPIFLAATIASAGCHTIQSEFILAKDVAVLIPDFAKLPADFRIGLVPLSGAPRTFAGADLARLARNQGVELADVPDVCFSRATAVPQEEAVRAAMRASLQDLPGIDDAKIEISQMSQRPAPEGELFFPRTGLQVQAGTAGDSMWLGYVRYSGGNFPVWARVRITIATTRIVTMASIPTGTPISIPQVRVETCEDSIFDETTARRLDDVIGMLPTSTLRANAVIRKNQLAPVPDVSSGELVQVQVVTKALRITLRARAQAGGTKGSTILIRNLTSGRDFRAKVTGRNQVTVQ